MARRAQFAPCRRETIGRTANSATTISVTSSGSADTKGSYATIGTAGFEYSGFKLCLKFANGRRYRFDVAVNTGGSDTIIVADYFVDASGALVGRNIWFPIAVPSGATIKMRCQDPTGSGVIQAHIMGEQIGVGGYQSYSRVISLTDFTGSDATNGVTLNGTTQTAYAAVVASTAARVAALYCEVSNRGDATRSAYQTMMFDVARGAGGSEVLMLEFAACNNGVTNLEAALSECAGPHWMDLPAGTRLATRAVAAGAAADSFGVCLMGLVP